MSSGGFVDNPVINSPFEEPGQHYQLNEDGQPTGIVAPGRRKSMQIVPVASARRRIKQAELELGDAETQTKVNQLVNDIREVVSVWRQARWPKTSPETRRLLEHWTAADRGRKLFFCQVEALETIIYLTEVDPDRFKAKIEEANEEANPGLVPHSLQDGDWLGQNHRYGDDHRLAQREQGTSAKLEEVHRCLPRDLSRNHDQGSVACASAERS